MLAKQCLSLLLGALAINAASALTFDPDWPLGPLLLKRQDDMSEAEYNCHDNCGQAIKAGCGTAPCTDAAFLHDYAACLQCAGPANEDVWQYYGGGLSTAPATATQPAVSAAVTATSAASETTGAAATATAGGSTASAGDGGASGSASSAGGSVAGSTAAASAAVATAAAASSSASSAAAASSASATGATGAASGAGFGCVSMLGSLSVLWYFVLGF